MMRISCVFLESLLVCAFTAQGDVIFNVPRVLPLSGRYTDLRKVDFTC